MLMELRPDDPVDEEGVVAGDEGVAQSGDPRWLAANTAEIWSFNFTYCLKTLLKLALKLILMKF